MAANTPPLRVVFDSNIYVAAALRPGQYADTWLDIAALPASGLQLFVSRPILQEVRHKLVDKFGLPPTDIDRLLKRITHIATAVTPRDRITVVKNDPDDNAILECAIAASAQLIVTADHHLLRLGQYQGIGITHPRELKYIFAGDYKRAG